MAKMVRLYRYTHTMYVGLRPDKDYYGINMAVGAVCGCTYI